MAVGIREVADRAGVSIATVSNVLNKPWRVSATTVSRVQAVMDDIGFVPNSLARQLRTGGGTTLGMIVLDVSNPFFADLAHACEAAAEELSHTVILGSSDQLGQREDRYLDLFEEQRVKGMMIAPLAGMSDRIRRLRDRKMPLVLFDTAADGTFCSVTLDGRQGGYLAARHLIETGRSHIAFLGGPLRQVEDRWNGAMRACAESSGVRLTHIDTSDSSLHAGRAAAEVIERMRPEDRPDAIFAANDLLALGLLQSLVLSRSISVPHDLAIVGYDDIEYAASSIVPLSTIRQPVAALSREALRLIFSEADDSDHRHERVLLAPELVIRESSAPRS